MSKTNLEDTIVGIESKLEQLETSLQAVSDLYTKVLYTLEHVDTVLHKYDPDSLKLKFPEQSKPVQNKPLESKPKVYPKDTELLRKLIYQSTNDKTTSFLKNILDNQYPTITQKQKDVVDSIANSMYV